MKRVKITAKLIAADGAILYCDGIDPGQHYVRTALQYPTEPNILDAKVELSLINQYREYELYDIRDYKHRTIIIYRERLSVAR